jgi:predicted transcriptional regulator
MARINLFLPDEQLQRFDREAEQEGVSRSRLIQKAMEDYLERVKQEQEEARRRAEMETACRTMDTLAQKLGTWDPGPALRDAREARYGAGWKKDHSAVQESPPKKRRRA